MISIRDAGGHFLDLQALLGEGLRQARLNRLEATLHIDLGHVRAGAGLERRVDDGAAETTAGIEIQQVVGAIKLVFNQAAPALIDGLCRCTQVGGLYFHLWRRDIGVLHHG